MCDYNTIRLCAFTVRGAYSSIFFIGNDTAGRMIGMAEGFASPVGKNITIAVCGPDENAIDDVNLQVGKRYFK